MNKRLKRGLLLFLLITLLVGAVYGYRKLNIMIKEEIILDVDTAYDSIELKYGDSYDFAPKAELNNYWLCTATCHHEIMDISTGALLFNETFYATNNKEVSPKVQISAKRGYGQAIYQYTIECRNIPDSKCPSTENSYQRRSTLVVNYEPNARQKNTIAESIYMFDKIALDLAQSEFNLNNATTIIYNSDINFSDTLKDEVMSAASSVSALRESEQQTMDLWDRDMYEEAYQALSTINSRSQSLYETSSTLLGSSANTVYTYNDMVRIHSDNLRNAAIIRQMLSYYPGQIGEFKSDAMTSLTLVNINTDKMNRMVNYPSLLNEARLEQSNINDTMSAFNHKANATYEDYVDLQLGNQLACATIGCSPSNIDFNLTGIHDVEQRCSIYHELTGRLKYARTVSETRRLTFNGSLSDIRSEENRFMLAVLKDLPATLSNRSSTYVSIIAYQNLTSEQPYAYTQYYYLDFDPMIASLEQIGTYCSRAQTNFTLRNFTLLEKNIPSFNEQITLNRIKEPAHKCCAYDRCSICGAQSKNPVILLHGHAFNVKNSAFQSTEIFNVLEQKLIARKYISLGIFKPYEIGAYKDLEGKINSNAIIMFKPTYYVSVLTDILSGGAIESKDESIEVYADRLEESVDATKAMTRSDKVDIVAHSMGGLVARRYIQKYGSQDIGRLVLVGTPNHGIDDRVHSFCGLLGNEKECDEMQQGSDFLSLVNQNYTMPETYVIIGRGCRMQNEDGDGVVRASSAQLEGFKTYYIDGDCNGASLWHNEMLYSDEMASRIDSILE